MMIALPGLRVDFFGPDIPWVTKIGESLCIAGALGFALQKKFAESVLFPWHAFGSI